MIPCVNLKPSRNSWRRARWEPRWWASRWAACPWLVQASGARPLPAGAEDSGLPQRILSACNAVVAIESVRSQSYNLAVSGSIVMYHRTFGFSQTRA